MNDLKILLTGGAGFLGKALVNEILSPDAPVPCGLLRIFDLNRYTGPADERIEMVQADIRNRQALVDACQGIDAVIHAAAIVDWGTHPESEVYAVNYEGTCRVVEACRTAGVKFLIYTGSLDAIYTGTSMTGIDESVPYPASHPNMYCKSKALAEKVVLEANGVELTTCVLRPADIYGPADPFHIGSLIDMAKSGFYVRLGDGTAHSQHVFVGNMAHAHLQVLQALVTGNITPAGKAYFITDGVSSNFFKFFDAIIEGAGYRIWPKNLWIPKKIAYSIGACAEFIALLVSPFIRYNPKFSRFAVMYTCADFTFKTDKAKKDFGFRPKYSHDEAFEMTVKYYRESISHQQSQNG